MADEVEGAKQAKTKSHGKMTIAKLSKVKVWKDYEAKSKVAADANAAHEAAKGAMRDYLKTMLGLDADVNLDFGRNAAEGTITVFERLEKKEKKAKGTNSLDDLIK